MGQSKLNYFVLLEDAKKDFEKKFRDKTKNSWAERDRFVAHPGKYTLIEVQGEEETQEAVVKVERRSGQGGCMGLSLAKLCIMLGPAPGAGALPSCAYPHAPSIPRWTEAH